MRVRYTIDHSVASPRAIDRDAVCSARACGPIIRESEPGSRRRGLVKKCASCTKDLPDAALHCVFCGAKQAPAPACAGDREDGDGLRRPARLEQLRQQAATANAARSAPVAPANLPAAAPYSAPRPANPSQPPPAQGLAPASAANAKTMFAPSSPTGPGPAPMGPGPMGHGPAPMGPGPMGPGPAPMGPGPMGHGPAPMGPGPMGPGPGPMGPGPMGHGPAPMGPGPMGHGPAPMGPAPMGPAPMGPGPAPMGSLPAGRISRRGRSPRSGSGSRLRRTAPPTPCGPAGRSSRGKTRSG